MYKDAAYSSGFVAIKRHELLDSQRVERMINAQGVANALLVLLDCGYDRALLTKSSLDVGLLLDNELEKSVQFFSEYCTDNALHRACLKRFDYHNAKVAVKARHCTNISKHALYSVGLLDKDTLLSAIDQSDYYNLPSPMAQALQQLDCKANDLSGGEIDVVLDSAMYADILPDIKKISSTPIKQYFIVGIDTCNIMTALRLKRLGLNVADGQFVQGGSIGTESLLLLLGGKNAEILQEFCQSPYLDAIEGAIKDLGDNQSIEKAEKELGDLLFDKSTQGVLNIFTNEPLFAWYTQKLEEIKTVKLIIAYKKNIISADGLKKRLRGIYA